MTATELVALLADASQNGAYFVDARDRESLAEAANALGFTVAAIDCRGVRDRDDALDRIAHALRFPPWFGGNWDALLDCLRDLSWLPDDGTLLLFDHAADWRDADPAAFAVLLDVLDAAARDWSAEGTPFWALLPLPGERLRDIDEIPG